jgi:MFS family permease
MMLPLLQTIHAQAAGPQRLGRLTAAIAVPALVAPIVGPVIGGLILDSLSRRWIFFINVPVCAIALLLAWRYMHVPAERGEHPLDVLGLALLSPGLAAIVYGFSEAGTRGGFGGGHVLVPLLIGVRPQFRVASAGAPGKRPAECARRPRTGGATYLPRWVDKAPHPLLCRRSVSPVWVASAGAPRASRAVGWRAARRCMARKPARRISPEPARIAHE